MENYACITNFRDSIQALIAKNLTPNMKKLFKWHLGPVNMQTESWLHFTLEIFSSVHSSKLLVESADMQINLTFDTKESIYKARMGTAFNYILNMFHETLAKHVDAKLKGYSHSLVKRNILIYNLRIPILPNSILSVQNYCTKSDTQ